MSQKDKDNKYSTMVSKNNTVVDSCFCKPHTHKTLDKVTINRSNCTKLVIIDCFIYVSYTGTLWDILAKRTMCYNSFTKLVKNNGFVCL